MQSPKPKQNKEATENIPKGKSSASLQAILFQNIGENLHLIEHSCVVVQLNNLAWCLRWMCNRPWIPGNLEWKY